MNKSLKIVLVVLLITFSLSLGLDLAFAQNQVKLPNPLGDAPENADPRVIIGNVIRALLGIVGSLALAVFIYGGFTWVISAGNDEKIKKGKDMIIWASFGLAVIFASYALVSFVIGAVAGTGAGSDPEASETLNPAS